MSNGNVCKYYGCKETSKDNHSLCVNHDVPFLIPSHSCSVCGGEIIGDGYTSTMHCENADESDYEFNECDDNVTECKPVEEFNLDDYVLASHWAGESPNDLWSIGFISEIGTDSYGNWYKLKSEGVMNLSFSHVRKITAEEGEKLLKERKRDVFVNYPSDLTEWDYMLSILNNQVYSITVFQDGSVSPYASIIKVNETNCDDGDTYFGNDRLDCLRKVYNHYMIGDK